MDAVAQFYHAIKFASQIIEFSYGRLMATRISREEYLQLPVHIQISMIHQISNINFFISIDFKE